MVTVYYRKKNRHVLHAGLHCKLTALVVSVDQFSEQKLYLVVGSLSKFTGAYLAIHYFWPLVLKQRVLIDIGEG
jgi:hypothetical protein